MATFSTKRGLANIVDGAFEHHGCRRKEATLHFLHEEQCA